MTKFNLEPIESRGKTQYNDFRGFISIDNKDFNKGIPKLMKDKGIDEKYYLYGFEIHAGEHVEHNQNYTLTLLVIDSDKYKHRGADDLYTVSLVKPLEIEQIDIKISLQDLFKYLKRLDFCVQNKYATSFNVEINQQE